MAGDSKPSTIGQECAEHWWTFCSAIHRTLAPHTSFTKVVIVTLTRVRRARKKVGATVGPTSIYTRDCAGRMDQIMYNKCRSKTEKQRKTAVRAATRNVASERLDKHIFLMLAHASMFQYRQDKNSSPTSKILTCRLKAVLIK